MEDFIHRLVRCLAYSTIEQHLRSSTVKITVTSINASCTFDIYDVTTVVTIDNGYVGECGFKGHKVLPVDGVGNIETGRRNTVNVRNE
jgi:hypothetical protein